MGCTKFVNFGVKAFDSALLWVFQVDSFLIFSYGAFCLINYRRLDRWRPVCFLVLNVLVYIEILVYADWHKAVAILWFWSKSSNSPYLSSWNSRDGWCLLQADHGIIHEGSTCLICVLTKHISIGLSFSFCFH